MQTNIKENEFETLIVDWLRDRNGVLGTRFWTVFYGQIQNLVFSYLLARQLFMLCPIHGFILIRC